MPLSFSNADVLNTAVDLAKVCPNKLALVLDHAGNGTRAHLTLYERLRQERRSAFVRLTTLSITESFLEALVGNALKTLLPDLNTSTKYVLP